MRNTQTGIKYYMTEVVELLLLHLHIIFWHPVKFIMLTCRLCCKQHKGRFVGSLVNSSCPRWLSQCSSKQTNCWPAPFLFLQSTGWSILGPELICILKNPEFFFFFTTFVKQLALIWNLRFVFSLLITDNSIITSHKYLNTSLASI